jgi:hypothetical protein
MSVLAIVGVTALALAVIVAVVSLFGPSPPKSKDEAKDGEKEHLVDIGGG